MRYVLAKWLYRLRFPTGNLHGCDFRPHFDGFLINTHVVIDPQVTPEETRTLAYRRWVQMFRWVRRLRFLFGRGDKIQMVVGFKSPPRQLLKGWLPADRLGQANPMTLTDVGGYLGEQVQWDASVTIAGR